MQMMEERNNRRGENSSEDEMVSLTRKKLKVDELEEEKATQEVALHSQETRGPALSWLDKFSFTPTGKSGYRTQPRGAVKSKSTKTLQAKSDVLTAFFRRCCWCCCRGQG